MPFDFKYDESELRIIVALGLVENHVYSPVVDLTSLIGEVSAVYEELVMSRNSFFFDDSMYRSVRGVFGQDPEKRLFYFHNNLRKEFDKASRLASFLATGRLSLDKQDIVIAKNTLKEISNINSAVCWARNHGNIIDCLELAGWEKKVREIYRTEAPKIGFSL